MYNWNRPVSGTYLIPRGRYTYTYFTVPWDPYAPWVNTTAQKGHGILPFIYICVLNNRDMTPTNGPWGQDDKKCTGHQTEATVRDDWYLSYSSYNPYT